MIVATDILRNRSNTLGDDVRGLLFDLDNTLIDRESTFIRFVSCFYEERLRDATTMTRDEVVARMVHWDRDGYAEREAMFAKWVDEWPEAGLERERVAALVSVRDETTCGTGCGRQRSPGRSQRASSALGHRHQRKHNHSAHRPAGRLVSISSPRSSSFRKRLVMPNRIRGFFATR